MEKLEMLLQISACLQVKRKRSVSTHSGGNGLYFISILKTTQADAPKRQWISLLR